MSTPFVSTTRFTLRDLPLPAKLVLTTFLISVGIGYMWAMAQIHFKHASSGNPLPTSEDMVTRFSGVPWPIEPKPDLKAAETKTGEVAKGQAAIVGVKVKGVKIQSLITERCATCHSPGGEKDEIRMDSMEGISKYLQKSADHPFGKIHTLVNGGRNEKLGPENMVPAFFEKSDGWKKLTKTPEDRQKVEAEREAERLAVSAWLEAGAPKANYDADAFPLPTPEKFDRLTAAFVTEATPLPNTASDDRPKSSAAERWKAAERRQLKPDALTQSTHAHLLTFSILWAATGLVFAFTSYSTFLRCIVSPIVLIAQVADVACWWLARLDGVGPYFALAIMATGAVVGLGLGAQIVLSIWNMYGCRGKMVIAILFLTGAGLFGLTYVKVIHPQLQAEKDFAEKQVQ